MADAKADLHAYLQRGRDALLWKLEGLSEHDVRRPLVPSGTNLLGLVTHLTGVELGYFAETFGRPFDDPPWWFPDSDEPNVDMWARPEESRAEVVHRYRRVCAHSDEVIRSLPLDAPGEVPHWRPERRRVTLHRILVHVTAETHRHAGHADLVRELIDGALGLYPDNSNLPPDSAAAWEEHRRRVEEAARQAAGRDAAGRG